MLTLLKQQSASQFKSVPQLLVLRALSTTRIVSTTEHQGDASQANHYDIIIAGGGLVGTTLAAALAKHKVLAEKRVLLLEGAPPFSGFSANSEYRNRVSAINNGSVELFQSIGAWDHMVKARVKPVKQMQVWDASSDALIQFQHDHFANDVACIVENDLILDAVYAQLSSVDASTNINIRNNARIESVRLPAETGTGYSEVGLKDGETFSCELLVGADGANSLVRKQMNVEVFSINYDSMGVVATLKVSDAADNAVAWQRFIPTGPVAMLPLSETLSSMVWSTNIAHAKQLVNLPEAQFVDALNEAFYKEYPKNDIVMKALNGLNSILSSNVAQLRQYPPRVTGVVDNSRAIFPLGFLHAASYVSIGAALIGDAAHRVHPLAGQGVNLGFSDVRILVEALSEAAYSGAKLSDKQYLLKYERKSLTNNVPIMIGVHGLQTLYSTTFSPVVLLRSLGLQLTQSIPRIKNEFMKRAIG